MFAQEVIDAAGRCHELLPLLLQRLITEQRRLLWHRYLREHPLNPRQIERVLGLLVPSSQRSGLKPASHGAMEFRWLDQQRFIHGAHPITGAYRWWPQLQPR